MPEPERIQGARASGVFRHILTVYPVFGSVGKNGRQALQSAGASPVPYACPLLRVSRGMDAGVRLTRRRLLPAFFASLLDGGFLGEATCHACSDLFLGTHLGVLRFGENVDAPAGQLRGQTGVLALAANGQESWSSGTTARAEYSRWFAIITSVTWPGTGPKQ